ncbi:lactonase family protein [Paenibacillus cymbidii]|uniref:lactonase family protein n=1 Tax=Paenibacillus cymbidii TaxID=1639034 RepID=UPI00107FF400|nr:lactonase family protein [Paenibacillus cymbidii]
MGKTLVFVGSYAEQTTNGLYVYELNETTGELKLQDELGGLQNPTFLNVDESRGLLYVAAEQLSPQGERIGSAATYEIDPAAGKLKQLDHVPTIDTTTCHIQRDRTDRFLVVVSYGGGQVGLLAIEADGRVGKLLDKHRHEGSSVNPERQEKPHPHSAFFSPDNRFVFIPDLGLDRIVAYELDTAGGTLVSSGETVVHAGAGPRHMAFHPNGGYAFVINELDSTIESYRYDAHTGAMQSLQVISTLPEAYDGESWCAEIALSSDGRFVYGSNRGHDSIAVFSFDAGSATLSPVEYVSTEGGHPRHFALTADGRFLIAANRDGNNLVTYRVDAASGRLTPTGHQASASKPVCVKPVRYEL